MNWKIIAVLAVVAIMVLFSGILPLKPVESAQAAIDLKECPACRCPAAVLPPVSSCPATEPASSPTAQPSFLSSPVTKDSPQIFTELEKAACGDGVCSANEDCDGCVADCACKNGYSCEVGVCRLNSGFGSAAK